MSTDRIASLQRIGLLRGLSDEELAALAPRCRWKSVRGGELIIGHKDQSYVSVPAHRAGAGQRLFAVGPPGQLP
jgi:hypothetical protein